MGRRPSLEVRDLWAGDRDAPAVRGVSLAVHAGSVVVVLGGPGAGKSRLLRCVGLDFAPLSGSILLHGVDIAGVSPDRRRRLRTDAIELVHPPAAPDQDDPTVPPPAGGVVLGPARRATVPVAGMRQRIQIAKVLTRRTDVLLLDEPLLGVEHHVCDRILDLVRRLRATGDTAVLVASRDPEVARLVADEVVVLQAGAVVEQGPADEVLSHPSDPHTAAMLDARRSA
ncbi:MAG TPA: ATP-binding cassette domain-containing protein [Acidimicrobiales bacterium]|nr:ATP-binding cassette domain-containing protein [Acidimicrobiales bacterium]